MNDYEKQAIEFLEKTNTTLTIKFLKFDKYFQDEEEKRDIYEITLNRGNRSYLFTFGQSIQNSRRYVDKQTKQEYFCDGKSLNYKTQVSEKYLKNYCKEKPGKYPKQYDVLSCLEKCDPDTFENFCSDFGLDSDSRKAEKLFLACKNQYDNLCKLFSDDEMNELQEIN